MKECAEKYRMVEPIWSSVSAAPSFTGADGRDPFKAAKKRFDVDFYPEFLLVHMLDLRFL